jgi:cell division protein FtsW
MKRQGMDHTLLACVVSMLALGLVMVFSASAGSALARSHDKFTVIRSQFSWAIVGLGVMGLCARFDYRNLRYAAWPMLGLSMITLLLVFVPGLGMTKGGATRWLRLGGFSFQPSELAKLALVLYLASSLSDRSIEERSSFQRFVLPALGVIGVLAVCVLKQPNLSYTVILATVGFLMISLQYRHWPHMASLALSGVVMAGWLVVREPYRMKRYLAFLDPWKDQYGSGWNIIQSLYALASGGLWGLGVGRGRQKFEYLPQEHSDYIFAIIGEELGFVGTAAIVLLFLCVLWRGLRIAVRAPDEFGTMLAYGITMSFTIQAIINISVVVGAIPPTGVPLPLISSGGSSLVASLAAAGVLLSISSRGQDPEKKRRPRPAVEWPT